VSNSSSEAKLNVSDDALKALASVRIYFGHQSVGYDIMKGVEEVVRQHPGAGLRIVDTHDPTELAAPVFAHSLNGENKKPLLKISAFAELMDNELNGAVDVAFFKFCYVDIQPDTDVVKLFEAYRDSMASLAARHPATTFVHVTSPVTTIQSGPTAWIKGALGRPDGYAVANVNRARFNDLLISEYGGRAPLFDLAAVEATWENGDRRTFSSDGRSYGALVEAYTDDGKHLNERGGRWVAVRFIEFLAEVVGERTS
jgi:hypothetical protein